MRFSTLSAAALLPLFALADYPTTDSLTTTITSTQTLTKTITVSEVVASVTSTYGMNSTSAVYAATGTGSVIVIPTASTSSPAIPTVSPSNFLGAAPSLNAMYAGSAGLLAMIAAALL
jgi:hypothetical protein